MARFQCNVISYVLQRTIDLTVIIPTASIPEAFGLEMAKKATHKIEEPYPVLYLLHGIGNNHTNWTSYSNVELFAEERNIAVVMISGENKFYRTVPGDNDYYRFLEEEIPEFITNMFPVYNTPEHTYIAGLSMGGAGALMHGIENPQKYQAIGAFSAAITMENEKDERNVWGMPNLCDAVKQTCKENKQIPPVYMSCGEADALLSDNQSFKKCLEENGTSVTWSSTPELGHEWTFWNQEIQKFLDWIPRTDGYAKQGIRKI